MIEVVDLVKAFGDLPAVRGLSLRVDAGEVYGLVGPDGAGKTTTLRLMCGALEPDSGRVRVAGHDVAAQTEQARASLGYLAQRFSLYSDLTVAENLRFFAEVRGLGPQLWAERTEELLAFVELGEFAGRRAGQLSGGMKQKLGLATALIHSPQVLLLDEPTVGVDPVTRASFWQLLGRLAADGVAVLLTTPYMDEASRCHRVGFMHTGRLILEGEPAQLARRLEGQVLELRARPRRLVESIAWRLPGVEAVQSFGDRMHLRVSHGQSDLVRRRLGPVLAQAGAVVERLEAIEPNLEDIFMQLLDEDAG